MVIGISADMAPISLREVSGVMAKLRLGPWLGLRGLGVIGGHGRSGYTNSTMVAEQGADGPELR
jgi:hypothetical protein